MKYTINRTANELKPLADFYDGECFAVLDDDGEIPYMTINLGVEDWQTPKTNIRFAVNLETATLASFRDDFRYQPVEVIAEFDISDV